MKTKTFIKQAHYLFASLEDPSFSPTSSHGVGLRNLPYRLLNSHGLDTLEASQKNKKPQVIILQQLRAYIFKWWRCRG